jgi:hypothetical protein
MMPAPGLAHEVSVEVAGHDHRLVPAWAPPSGPEIYYGTHYNHVPAYPEPDLSNAYPVPIFPGVRRLPVIRYDVSGHVRWCHAHYRSYRASDNSFQPNHGPRRPCRSPYA